MKIELEENEAVQIVPIEYPHEGCPIDALRDMLPLNVRLEQLAEEAAELAQAALKLVRTFSKVNPARITRRQAEDKLLEEIADVKLCLHVAGLEDVQDKITVNRIINAKAERWLTDLLKEDR